MTDLRFGIDLGGSKIEAALLNRAGAVIWQQRQPTHPTSYRNTIASIAHLAAMARRATGWDGDTIGIGLPAVPNQDTGKLTGASLGYLNNRDFATDVGEALGGRVRLANDANCFALSEAQDGAAAGLPVVLGVIIGTGCGAGLVVEGRIMAGRHGIAGEIGHIALPWQTDDERVLAKQTSDNPRLACVCGTIGCVESFVSGPAVSREYASLTGENLAVEAIAKRTNHDQQADLVLSRLAHRLARTLAMLINMFDPHAIVLGGGLSQLTRLYDEIPAIWRSYVYTQREIQTRLLPPKYGAASGVRGAAQLWDLD